MGGRLRMLRLGNLLIREVTRFKSHARVFCYEAFLLGHTCPVCNAKLRMIRDGEAECTRCRSAVDPAVYFQPCEACGGALKRILTHYVCERCGRTTRSRFAFDAMSFDRAYFAKMMRRSRERSRRRRRELHERLLVERSQRLLTDREPDIGNVPGLGIALDRLAAAPFSPDLLKAFMRGAPFDMETYRRHIMAQFTSYELLFEAISPLVDDLRRDRIYRFVTVIHMWHRGEVQLVQQNNILVVERHEPDSEGQGIH